MAVLVFSTVLVEFWSLFGPFFWSFLAVLVFSTVFGQFWPVGLFLVIFGPLGLLSCDILGPLSCDILVVFWAFFWSIAPFLGPCLVTFWAPCLVTFWAPCLVTFWSFFGPFFGQFWPFLAFSAVFGPLVL